MKKLICLILLVFTSIAFSESYVSIITLTNAHPDTTFTFNATQQLFYKLYVKNLSATDLGDTIKVYNNVITNYSFLCKVRETYNSKDATWVISHTTYIVSFDVIEGNIKYLKIHFGAKDTSRSVQIIIVATTTQNFEWTSKPDSSINIASLPDVRIKGGQDTTRLDPSFANSVGLGTSVGKTIVNKNGIKITTDPTPNQEVLTYTVTSGKTFYMEYLSINVRLTDYTATTGYYGDASLTNNASGSGMDVAMFIQMNAGTGISIPSPIIFPEPIPFIANSIIKVLCSPTTDPLTWIANFGGYEK